MPRETDPHAIARSEDVRALAQRLANLADELHEMSTEVKVMIERGLHRDALTVDIRRDVEELTDIAKDLQKQVASSQLTPDQIAFIKMSMVGKDRSEWFRQQSKYYFWGTISIATAIFVLRDWIRAALVYLRILAP